MHQRDLLGERQDDGIHLEKVLEGLQSIFLHPEDAIGDNHSGYSECEEIVRHQIFSSVRHAGQRNPTNVPNVTRASGGALI